MELPSLTEQTFLVTGANSGIGKETVRVLAEHGASVIMVCRSRARGERAHSELIEATENNRLHLLLADLSSQGEVRKLVDEVRSEFDRLDALVNNAGIWLGSRELTEDQVEKTLAVNYLAPFLLTNLLLDLLKESAPARIVNVVSDAHHYFSLNLDDLQHEKVYNGLAAYARSKTALVMFTYELARRLQDTQVTANCVHPGTVRSNLWRAEAGWMARITGLFSGLMPPAKNGAKGVVYLAAHPQGARVNGQYFKATSQKPSSDETYDEQRAARLWQVSEKLTGLRVPDTTSHS